MSEDRTLTISQWIDAVAAKLKTAVTKQSDCHWQITMGSVPINISYQLQEEALKFVVPFVDIPTGGKLEFFEMLLVRNLAVKFGAYAIGGKQIVFCDTIATADLDFSEFLASLNSIFDEVKYTLEFLREFGSKSDASPSFEESIGNFTFSEDPAQRREALEMLKFSVGEVGVKTFVANFKELEGQEYLPAHVVAEILA
jgi:hypothetical protein